MNSKMQNIVLPSDIKSVFVRYVHDGNGLIMPTSSILSRTCPGVMGFPTIILSPRKATDITANSISRNSPRGRSSVHRERISSNCEIIMTENGNSLELTVITGQDARQKTGSGKNVPRKKPARPAGGNLKLSGSSSSLLSEFPDLIPRVSRRGLRR